MSNFFSAPPEEIEYLLSTQAVRDRSAKIFELSVKGKTHFKIEIEKLDLLAQKVAENTRKNYPSLKVPLHSRWKHFQVGGIDRNKILDSKFNLASLSPIQKVKSQVDLTVLSVLLDAGAGTQWKFSDKDSGLSVGRSEGLALASREMFINGEFSDSKENPFQVSTGKLLKFNSDKLTKGFQVTDSNPLVGIEGRVQLLNNLGRILEEANVERIFDLLFSEKELSKNSSLNFKEILSRLHHRLGKIWPGRLVIEGQNMGDCWIYAPLGGGTGGLVPFHKLPQWLTLSLAYPLEGMGLKLNDADSLTGLPEYRNGGLFIDGGVLVLRNPKLQAITHAVESELVVEWRALTICLLDLIAPKVRSVLGKTEDEFPLGSVLEGGTWATGREIAKSLRPGGGSPLLIRSDGTVF